MLGEARPIVLLQLLSQHKGAGRDAHPLWKETGGCTGGKAITISKEKHRTSLAG